MDATEGGEGNAFAHGIDFGTPNISVVGYFKVAHYQHFEILDATSL